MTSNSDPAIPIYDQFASVYNETMSGVPYRIWSKFISEVIRRHLRTGFRFHKRPVIVELAAGTGKIAEHLEDQKVIQLDIARAMLLRNPSGRRLQAHMQEIPVRDKSADVALCIHSSLNYLPATELSGHFREVARIVRRGGLYVFDIATEANVLRNFHKRTFHERHNSISLSWENDYDAINGILVSRIRVSGQREAELHYTYIYPHGAIRQAIDGTAWQVLEESADYGASSSGRLLTLVLRHK